MASYTRYLATINETVNDYSVHIFESSPIAFAESAIRKSQDIKYSPIMPAYLTFGQGPPRMPTKLDSVTFLFANAPYKALGSLRSDLSARERSNVYFTEGLASIVLLNFTHERAKSLRLLADECPMEEWPLTHGKLNTRNVIVHLASGNRPNNRSRVSLPSTDNEELRVYVEQISASLASLWASYSVYSPTEEQTLRQITLHVKDLIQQHNLLKKKRPINDDNLARIKDVNAIISALVEVSAALSYAVTQGTSGSFPILSNRSPFPHHSLLGIGGAVRAITKYTRYLESAFIERSASQVILDHYSKLKQIVPGSISKYASGPEYKFPSSKDIRKDQFDIGGKLRQDDQIPLIAHFSLRHGFMESKFSVTAASEALTAEALPQWTLVTLSHEIMHSRVRTIFQALFGKTWHENDSRIVTQGQFDAFSKWFRTRKTPTNSTVATGLRNVILYFCYALEKYHHPTPQAEQYPRAVLTLKELNELYCRHKNLASEILVHFHDYYFVYASQPNIYIRSLWASWINVAGPYARPSEYLARSLATIACGTGYKTDAAFIYAKEILMDALLSLEAIGVSSALFDELRRLTSPPAESKTRAHFYPCYYLMDSIGRYFASRKIASKINRIESDPFSEGSTSVDQYTTSIYVYGEGKAISPIRYSVATLFKALSGQRALADSQWLSAWDYIVLSS
jgi:hypothetical protein